MDLTNLLNTIRDNATQEYQDRIPQATRENIADIRMAITDPNNAVVTNEFCTALLNMVIKQVIISKFFSDPLKTLKKGTKPLGDTVEEIYANFIKAKQYDPTGSELLTRELPDVKTIYHRMNRQDKYKVTIGPEQLAKAFMSYEKLGSFIQNIINTLYNSSELDEFVLIKNIIKDAYDNNALKIVNIADPTASEQNAKDFIKAVKIVSGDMEFPNDRYNAYTDVQNTDVVPVTTFSKKSEQILILDNPTNVSLSIDVLASTFNMSVAEFNDTRKIIIDAFPVENMHALLCDEMFFQVFDDLVTFREFENGEGLYKNYCLHVWQTLAYSVLVNAVAFVSGTDEDDDGDIDTYTISYQVPSTISSSNKRKSTTEGSSFTTTLSGVEDEVISVTMGGDDITATAYNSGTHKISIASVTGNIVISASEPEYANVYFTTGVSDITFSNTASQTQKGQPYTNTITGFTDGMSIRIDMNGVRLNILDVFNFSTGVISISNVTGDIDIITSYTVYTVTVMVDGTDILYNNEQTSITHGQTYTNVFTNVPDTATLTVDMGDVELVAGTDYTVTTEPMQEDPTYNTTTLTIPNVSSDLVIIYG